MVKELKHIINRVYISIETTGGFKPEISNDEIISAVQSAINCCDFQYSHEIFRVDSLTVDLSLAKKELHFLNERLSQVLLEEINSAIRDKNGEFRNIINQQYKDFLEYLQSGRIPWTSGELIYESQFLKDAGFREDLMTVLKAGKIPIDRFLFKLTSNQLLTVLNEYFDKSFCRNISELIQRFSTEIKQLKNAYDLDYRAQKFLFQQIFYQLFLENHKPEAMSLIKASLPATLLKTGIDERLMLTLPFFKELLKEKKQEVGFSSKIKSSLKKQEKFSPTESIQVSNAGFVLLHPFLPRFFGKLGLLEGKDFQDEFCRERAVCLSHYLATGETIFPTEQLALPKFLCRFPFHLPIPEHLPVSPFEVEESNNLLENVINYWKVLKNTSIEGLRSNFFDRLGLLQKENNVWTLNIENQTSDVLIDRLPWPISPVKLPWMPELLTVKWN